MGGGEMEGAVRSTKIVQFLCKGDLFSALFPFETRFRISVIFLWIVWKK